MTRPRRIIILLILGALAILATLFHLQPSSTSLQQELREVRRNRLQLRDGKLLENGLPFTGYVVEYYNARQIKSRSAVLNGQLEGLSEGWHTNGLLQITETYSHGISHGLRTKYHSSGQKLSEANVINGVIQGQFQRWHPNGQLSETLCMTNGLAHGEATSYHPNGAIKALVHLDRGNVLDQQFTPQKN